MTLVLEAVDIAVGRGETAVLRHVSLGVTAGESRVIRFTPREPLPAGAAPIFTGYDLQSCQGNG